MKVRKIQLSGIITFFPGNVMKEIKDPFKEDLKISEIYLTIYKFQYFWKSGK